MPPPPNKETGEFAAVAPMTSTATLYTLDVTTADASITLPNGIYRVISKSGGGVFAGAIGSTASIPTSGAANVVTGFGFNGGTGEIVHIRDDDGTKALHAVVSAGTDTLLITKLK